MFPENLEAGERGDSGELTKGTKALEGEGIMGRKAGEMSRAHPSGPGKAFGFEPGLCLEGHRELSGLS